MRLIVSILAVLLITAPAGAQNLDGRPYNPDYDVDVDMYLHSYENSSPRMLQGALEVQDILTRGQHLKPAKRGAVLEYANWLARASLAGGKSIDATLKGEQYVMFIISGEGTLTAGEKKTDHAAAVDDVRSLSSCIYRQFAGVDRLYHGQPGRGDGAFLLPRLVCICGASCQRMADVDTPAL